MTTREPDPGTTREPDPGTTREPDPGTTRGNAPDALHGIDGPDLALRYADRADGVTDIFLPAARHRDGSGSAELIALIHGGYWRQKYDRMHLCPFARGLAERGFAVALPEFRRVGGGGEWPVIGADIEAALRHTRGGLAAAAPGIIDPTAPYLIMGHSAGGHLALWAGLRAGPGDCRRIIALAPVSDLVETARRGLSDRAAQALLGGGPDQVPKAYADADPATYLPSAVPIVIIHGDADEDVPVELSRTFAAAHPEIRYVELPGADHFEVIDPDSTVFADILRETAEER